MGGPRTGVEKKNIPPGQPREGVRERGMCLQGAASGARPAASQTQLLVIGLPVAMAAPGKEEKTSQQIAGKEGGVALPTGVAGLAFFSQESFLVFPRPQEAAEQSCWQERG